MNSPNEMLILDDPQNEHHDESDLEPIHMKEFKLLDEYEAELADRIAERAVAYVGPTSCTISTKAILKNHRKPHYSHAFNRARKGVR